MLVVVACCPWPLPAAATAYTPAPFSDYQPILDRMPFGALPPGFGQAAAEPVLLQTDAQLQAEQQKLAKQVNMSAVTITPNGATAIGFTDLSAKPPVSFYLLVGDSAGGWTVLNADYDEEWAQIEKEGVTITLQLGKGLIDAPPVRAPAEVANAPAATPAPDEHPAAEAAPALRPGLIRRPSQANMPPIPGLVTTAQRTELPQTREEIAKLKEKGGDTRSYIERLRERKQLEKEEKAAAEQTSSDKLLELARKVTQDELAKKEREMNMNLIGQDKRPISNIELTPEEEAAPDEKDVLGEVQ